MAVEAMGMQIRIPQGDTGNVKFVADSGNMNIASNGKIEPEDRALFTIVSRSGAMILRKVLSPNEELTEFQLPFVYDDTAKLKPDTYEWSLRIVREGVFDANGRITSVKNVHTPVMAGKFIVMPVAGGAK